MSYFKRAPAPNALMFMLSFCFLHLTSALVLLRDADDHAGNPSEYGPSGYNTCMDPANAVRGQVSIVRNDRDSKRTKC